MNGITAFEANQEEPGYAATGRLHVDTVGWEVRHEGDTPGHGGCRSSFLEPPVRSFFPPARQKSKRPVEAAGAVDARNAPTAPWKTAQNAVSHSYHRLCLLSLVTRKLLPMFPVNFVTYVPGCTL
jgi:hypothetical protein